MFSKKNILSFILASLIVVQLPVFADDISDARVVFTDAIWKLIEKYEARIKTLESENTELKQTISNLKGSGTVTAVSTTNTSSTLSYTGVTTITSTMTKTGIYNAVMNKVNSQMSAMLKENSLSGSYVWGLFEFIEPNVFFLSLDDGNNPTGVTAFRAKVLYTFDNNLNFTRIGLFNLDFTSQKYITVFGSNPYTKGTRTRVLNPNYKGKLLDTVSETIGTGITTSTTTTSTVSTTTTVTLAQIKKAYDAKKLLEAITLSDSYIVNNPNSIDVLRIRYRSYYIIGKYDNSLAEIKKIETLQGSSFEKTVACDAAVIAKIAKKTDANTYYSAICKTK